MKTFLVKVIDENPDWDEFVRLIETRPEGGIVEILSAVEGGRTYIVSIMEEQ